MAAVTGRDMRQLEQDLQRDLVDTDKAVVERVRKAVKEFLLHEASLLVGASVKDEKRIIELIQLHARVNLLQLLVDSPKNFTLKDQKELFKQVGEVIRPGIDDAPVNPLNLISGLNISDEEKAKLISAVADVARDRVRGQLKGGDGTKR